MKSKEIIEQKNKDKIDRLLLEIEVSPINETVNIDYVINLCYITKNTIKKYIKDKKLECLWVDNEPVFLRTHLLNFLKNNYIKVRTESKMLKASIAGSSIYEGKTCEICKTKSRYISNSSCVDCSTRKGIIKLNDQELMKQYRTPEKVKQYTKKYRSLGKHRCSPSNSKVSKFNHNLIKNYNIDASMYNKLLTEQNNVCAICKRCCVSGRRLAVDHDHKTGKVRGLLCGRCNTGLGNFTDSIEFLEEAIKYLKHEK